MWTGAHMEWRVVCQEKRRVHIGSLRRSGLTGQCRVNELAFSSLPKMPCQGLRYL